MQTNQQNFGTSNVPKRSKSQYPEILPTYVVGLAINETYDNLMTTQQIICEGSSQSSIHSITSMITQGNDLVKLEKDEQCPYVHKTLETLMTTVKEKNADKTKNTQSEIIFNASITKQTKQDNKFRKKSRKNKRLAKFRNINFKCKHCKTITKKIELYYTKSKRNALATDIVQKGLCNLSNVINQSRVLKKVLAVENLFEEQQFFDNINIDKMSSVSSSSTKKGVMSHSSDSTITRKWSSSSSRNYYSSINSSNSVIQMSSENVIPYKTNVINVAVAMAFNKAKANDNKIQTKQFIMKNEETYFAKHELTRTETVVLPPIALTSKTPSFDNNPKKMVKSIEDAITYETLIDNNKKPSFVISIDEDTFVIARTSSDFNKSSFNSNLTLTNSETQSDETINGNENSIIENEYNNKKILNTVINFGVFPDTNPSTSKFIENTVIITKEHKGCVKKEDEVARNGQNDLSKNILKKPFDVEENVAAQKIITLPKEDAIRSKLKGNHEHRMKTDIEFQNSPPSTLADMWDRLSLLLDAALKRIEETLPDRIIKEIKKTLNFDEYKNFVLKIISEKKHSSEVKDTKVNKGVCVDMLETEADESLQCDLVQNQVIDQLITNPYSKEPINVPPGKYTQKLITKIFKEYFEALSPRVLSNIEIKEDVTVSGIEPMLAPDVESFSLFKLLLAVPMKFVKENAFVMTGVPTFLLILLCMYGLIIFIIKP